MSCEFAADLGIVEAVAVEQGGCPEVSLPLELGGGREGDFGLDASGNEDSIRFHEPVQCVEHEDHGVLAECDAVERLRGDRR
ncbi:MAG: hypothetical protein CL933_04020 [Deltaproteobacteria bacterium]|nr:hypothetical protein [Deltaproteobacteria bacterium]